MIKIRLVLYYFFIKIDFDYVKHVFTTAMIVIHEYFFCFGFYQRTLHFLKFAVLRSSTHIRYRTRTYAS